MISSAFCEELIKIGMTEETKERAKAMAKIIGAGAASAGAAHGLYTLGRHAAEKALDRPLKGAVARKYAPIAIPIIATIGGGLTAANMAHRQKVLDKAEQKGQALDAAKRGAS